jgi:hypothetical protein
MSNLKILMDMLKHANGANTPACSAREQEAAVSRLS